MSETDAPETSRLARPSWLVPLVLFDTVVKALAARRAFANGQRGWAIAIMVTNTVGVLPLAYLFFFQRRPGDPGAIAAE